ncbi:MAG: phosphotransferase enzyme family protein [Pseudomonadota bacterium]
MTDDWGAMAAAALAAWGGDARTLRLVKARENVVFRAELAGGPVALRLHRPGYQTEAAIRSELIWTGLLARRGLPVPAPVLTASGDLTARAGGRVASCVSWLGGDPVGAAETPLSGDADEQRALMTGIGRLLSRLHAETDRLTLPPSFERPVWNAEGWLGADPLWGRFWENPAFTPADLGIIQEARAFARKRLETMPLKPGDFGLIHADVLRENLLRSGEALALIDFDDCGFGHRLYDLATAVVQSLEEPGLPMIVAGLCAGYAADRGRKGAIPGDLALFVMLRTFASAGWIATRAGPDDPRQAFYAGRARRMAGHVLAGTAPWDDRP